MQYLHQVQGETDLAISRESLAMKIAARLREWILLEQLKPGAVVTERELAERLGVSRTPMREALRILAEEELIDMQVNRRPRIAQPSLERVLDLMDVLLSLESLAVRLCIERASADEVAGIANIQRQVQRLAGRDQPLDFFNADMGVHHAIVAASHNAPLIATHRQIGAAVFRARFLASRHLEWRSVTLQEHDDLVHAIVQRRADAAVEALIQHLGTVRNAITALFQAATKVDDLPLPQSSGSGALVEGHFGGVNRKLSQPMHLVPDAGGKDGS